LPDSAGQFRPVSAATREEHPAIYRVRCRHRQCSKAVSASTRWSMRRPIGSPRSTRWSWVRPATRLTLPDRLPNGTDMRGHTLSFSAGVPSMPPRSRTGGDPRAHSERPQLARLTGTFIVRASTDSTGSVDLLARHQRWLPRGVPAPSTPRRPARPVMHRTQASGSAGSTSGPALLVRLHHVSLPVKTREFPASEIWECTSGPRPQRSPGARCRGSPSPRCA
jgi:hypothetical protein